MLGPEVQKIGEYLARKLQAETKAWADAYAVEGETPNTQLYYTNVVAASNALRLFNEALAHIQN